MGTTIFACLVIWFAVAFPLTFCYFFDLQISEILEAFTDYIKTKIRILQEVNKHVLSFL